MNTTLKIKNFRVFGEEGVSLDLKPITILTGSNSSGKSSIAKAAFLLNGFIRQIRKAIDNKEQIELDKYKLDFTKYPNNLLGRFDKVVNEKSKDKTITIGYTVYSYMLSKEVEVSLVFAADKKDELNNAYLESITMSTEDGVFYYSSKNEPSYCNLNILKEDYVTFLLVEFAARQYCGVKEDYDIFGMTKEEYESKIKNLLEYLHGFEESRRKDVYRYINRTSNPPRIIVKNLVHVLERVKENGEIFSIPILDVLAKLDKKQVKDYISANCMGDGSEGFKASTRKVLEAFEKSEFDRFDLFFRDFENKYMEKVVCRRRYFHTPSKKIQVLKSDELFILDGNFDGNSWKGNPYDVKELGTLGDHGIELNKEEEEKNRIQEWESRELTFDFLYSVVMEWNKSIEQTDNEDQSGKEYVYGEPLFENFLGYVYHIAYELLTMFAEEVVKEALMPECSGDMSYVSSSRAKVKRLYPLEDGDDFSQLLQEYFEAKRLFEQSKKEYTPGDFMNKWIGKFGIGESISLSVDREGLGVQIRLHKKEGDEGRLLADEGYGVTQLVSILLQIEVSILSAQGEMVVDRFWGLSDLDGYDVFEETKFQERTISVEEPEIHLHPKYQSLLADMFLEAYQKYNIHFIIETHSEYLIRRSQVIVASGNYPDVEDLKKRCPFEVYYVPAGEKPYSLGYRPDGRFSNEFGTGFFDTASNLAFELF